MPAVSTSASRTTRRGRTAEKGKARARPAGPNTSTSASVDDSWDADSSVSRTQRNAKRRRVSPPQLSLRLDLDDANWEDEHGSQKTAVEEEFHMLEGPDMLPWVPVDPHAKDSEYVPPGVNALIEGMCVSQSSPDDEPRELTSHLADMKRALVVHKSERERAESRYAEEAQKRRELEQETARLAAANRSLEAERSAWTSAAAASLAASLENALVTDMARKLVEEFPDLKVSHQQRSGSAFFPASQPRLEPGPDARLARPPARTVADTTDTDVAMSDAYTQRPSPGPGAGVDNYIDEERGDVHARNGGPAPSDPPQQELPVHVRDSAHNESDTIPLLAPSSA